MPASTRHLRKPDRYGVPTRLSRQRVHLAAVRNLTARTAETGASVHDAGDTVDTQHYDDGEEWGRATVPKAELCVMKRLSEYVSVLPVVAKADTLTNERLNVVKRAVRRDFTEAGLSFALFEDPQTSPVTPSRTPPPEPEPEPEQATVPYAVVLPDRYHHGDGVPRTGTTARPSHQEYMTQYQTAKAEPGAALLRDAARVIQPGEFTRSYPWGVIDIANRSHSDFWALREAILGSNIQVGDPRPPLFWMPADRKQALRSRASAVYFEAYKRDSTSGRGRPSSSRSNRPPEQAHQALFPLETLGGSSPSILPSLPPTSLFSPQSNVRSSYQQDRIRSPSEYALPPLEMAIVTRSGDQRLPAPRPSPLAPISAVLNPTLKHSQSAPILVSHETAPRESPRSPKTVTTLTTSRQRTGRKIAVACNFCRCKHTSLDGNQYGRLTFFSFFLVWFVSLARKLKCDGGRPQCIQCMKRTVDCEYEPAAKRRGLGKHAHATAASQSGDPAHRPSGSAGGDDPNVLPPKSVACQFCRGWLGLFRLVRYSHRISQRERRAATVCNLGAPTARSATGSASISPRRRRWRRKSQPWPPDLVRPRLDPLSNSLRQRFRSPSRLLQVLLIGSLNHCHLRHSLRLDILSTPLSAGLPRSSLIPYHLVIVRRASLASFHHPHRLDLSRWNLEGQITPKESIGRRGEIADL